MTPYFVDEVAGIAIYCGDCRDVLPCLQRVDVALTDPPYSAHVHAKQWIGAALTENGSKRVSTAHQGLGFDPMNEELRVFVAGQFARLVLRWSLVFSDLESAHLWRGTFEASGLEYIRTLIWDKVDGAPQFTGDRPANGAEAITLVHPAGKKQWNGGGGRNVYRFRANGEPGDKPHPSTKPLLLMQCLASLFSARGETILDPFMGSGTTLEAAKLAGCKAIGIEIEERYCEIAAKRLSQEVFNFL